MRCAFSTVIKALSVVVMPMAVSVALAEGISTSFSGFGTVGGTFTSDGKYAYDHSPTESTGASNSLDVGLESRLGVQGVVNFDPQWSITAQEVAKLRGNTNFDPGTEWLFAQYQPEPGLKLRLGRVVLPVFLASDVINVGYAVPWFRAPNNVYSTEDFEHIDGAQVLWQHSLGALQLNLEATYGESQVTFDVGGYPLVSKSKSTFNAAVALSWRNLLVRYAETDLNSSSLLTLSATQTLSFNTHDHFHCVGLQYDDGKALLMSEWTKRDQPNAPGGNKPLIEDTSWYAAAGWHFGKFTPLVMYSVLSFGDSVFTGGASTTHTWDASVRYDVVRNLDLKLQITRAWAANAGYFVVPASTASKELVNVYSLGADFVF